MPYGADGGEGKKRRPATTTMGSQPTVLLREVRDGTDCGFHLYRLIHEGGETGRLRLDAVVDPLGNGGDDDDNEPPPAHAIPAVQHVIAEYRDAIRDRRAVARLAGTRHGRHAIAWAMSLPVVDGSDTLVFEVLNAGLDPADPPRILVLSCVPIGYDAVVRALGRADGARGEEGAVAAAAVEGSAPVAAAVAESPAPPAVDTPPAGGGGSAPAARLPRPPRPPPSLTERDRSGAAVVRRGAEAVRAHWRALCRCMSPPNPDAMARCLRAALWMRLTAHLLHRIRHPIDLGQAAWRWLEADTLDCASLFLKPRLAEASRRRRTEPTWFDVAWARALDAVMGPRWGFFDAFFDAEEDLERWMRETLHHARHNAMVAPPPPPLAVRTDTELDRSMAEVVGALCDLCGAHGHRRRAAHAQCTVEALGRLLGVPRALQDRLAAAMAHREEEEAEPGGAADDLDE